MGQIYGGRYELVDLLARGGSGAVWRVWDRRDQAYRAGKVLQQADSVALIRFVRETGWRINHPHVVAPLAWSGEDDRIIFTMPLVRGGSLATVQADNGPLPVGWTLDLVDQLLDALSAVHAEGLVHRDIKPGNILLEPTHDGRPDIRLGDFGIAAPVGEPRLTRVSEVIGTPGFLSPEALTGADPDPRQDLWSVGALVVHMLTGQQDGRIVQIPDAWRHTDLGDWVAALLAPAEQRIPTASQAREALHELDLQDLGATGLALHGDVEVFDQIPPLPAGWGAHGPQQWRRPSSDPSVARAMGLSTTASEPVEATVALVAPASDRSATPSEFPVPQPQSPVPELQSPAPGPQSPVPEPVEGTSVEEASTGSAIDGGGQVIDGGSQVVSGGSQVVSGGSPVISGRGRAVGGGLGVLPVVLVGLGLILLALALTFR